MRACFTVSPFFVPFFDEFVDGGHNILPDLGAELSLKSCRDLLGLATCLPSENGQWKGLKDLTSSGFGPKHFEQVHPPNEKQRQVSSLSFVPRMGRESRYAT